jgi:hypothetical protein
LIETIYSWVKDISIKSKAVRPTLIIWRKSTTKSMELDLLRAVVELEDISNRLDDLDVLVLVRVEVVQ